MSSSWGLTEMVLKGEAANDVYALLSRAKEECASEERDHCSEVIHTVKGDFCFAFGLENIYEDTGDDCPGLYFRISSEADYIGDTNDEEGKYFNLEDYEY